MPRITRAEVFDPDEIAIVHVLNRTSRRCFLMGFDEKTGRSFEHRKVWIEDRLKRLAAYFGIDLLGYAILSNHFHLLLRSRPDVVKTWTDGQVATRWLHLCPPYKNGKPREITEFDVNMIVNDENKVAMLRRRLSDISWWMRLLSQPIAQRANQEDNETGRFWAGRFRAIRIEDNAALLACAAYIDLNPIRATIAETLESSTFTSIHSRIESQNDNTESSKNPKSDAHLAPITCNTLENDIASKTNRTGNRCSDLGFLELTTSQYIVLLDWTARQIVPNKSGATPVDTPPIFKRINVSPNTYCELVKDFEQLFSVIAGKPESLEAFQSKRTHRHFQMRRKTKELFQLAA